MNKEGLTFRALSEKNLERCESKAGFNHRLNSWSINDWAVAVAGETGEMCNFAKKLKRVYDGIEPDPDLDAGSLIVKIGKEISDIVIYCDLLAQRMGLDLGEEVMRKFNETSDKIKSPINFK